MGPGDTTIEIIAKNPCIHWYLVLDKNQIHLQTSPSENSI